MRPACFKGRRYRPHASIVEVAEHDPTQQESPSIWYCRDHCAGASTSRPDRSVDEIAGRLLRHLERTRAGWSTSIRYVPYDSAWSGDGEEKRLAGMGQHTRYRLDR